jgi:hypothetical protein
VTGGSGCISPVAGPGRPAAAPNGSACIEAVARRARISKRTLGERILDVATELFLAEGYGATIVANGIATLIGE